MAESGGDDWSLILTKAQIRSLLSVYLLGNAYIGSAECTKEFQFGDMKVIPHHETFSTTIQPPYSSTKG
jgi:hypothetical protein